MEHPRLGSNLSVKRTCRKRQSAYLQRSARTTYQLTYASNFTSIASSFTQEQAFMAKTDLTLSTSVASLFRELASAAESDATPDFSISKKGSKITITVDSPDGSERFINSKESVPGLTRATTEQVQKLPIEERRQLVKKLHVEEELTQSEIAARTLYSQKTISNDLEALRKRGEL